MGKIAAHTLNVLTSQMSIIHEPTFKLAASYGSVAFAMCTVGTSDALAVQKNAATAEFSLIDANPDDPWKWITSLVREQVTYLLI